MSMSSLTFELQYYPSARILRGGDAFGLAHTHALAQVFWSGPPKRGRWLEEDRAVTGRRP